MPAVSRPGSHFYAKADSRPWDTLVVAEQGRRGATVATLKDLGEFRPTGLPGILVGSKAASSPHLPTLEALTGRVQRVFFSEQCVEFERDDVTETMCLLLEEQAHRLCGRSFYVRSHLRGMKGRVERPVVERALGDFLFERTQALGSPASVTFTDPDIIVVIELVGTKVAWAFADRERRALPFGKIR